MRKIDKISIIIPAYYADEKLLTMTTKCIKGFLDTCGTNNQIIVVDDASPIHREEKIKLKPYYKEIVRKENGGYAAAVNTGLQNANGNILIICNNDIEFVQDNWLKHLLKPLQEGYHISSIRNTEADGWDVEDLIEEGAKFGAIWAMKRKVYETIGGLDESFGKGYFEDLDFQKRAEDAGFKVAKNHAGLVEHLGKATFSVVDSEDKSYRNAMERFREKWGRVW